MQGGGWSWRPLDWSKALGWRLILAVCVIAAATAAAVVLLTTRGPSGTAAPKGATGQRMGTGAMSSHMTRGGKLTASQRLQAYANEFGWQQRNEQFA